MATARKTPVKRLASARSNASPATKKTRGAQTGTSKQKTDDTTTTGRKTTVKRTASARLNGEAKPASHAHTEEAEAAPQKGNGRAVTADGVSAQKLVPDSKQGEIVRKSRVLTADATVPVQIG